METRMLHVTAQIADDSLVDMPIADRLDSAFARARHKGHALIVRDTLTIHLQAGQCCLQQLLLLQLRRARSVTVEALECHALAHLGARRWVHELHSGVVAIDAA